MLTGADGWVSHRVAREQLRAARFLQGVHVTHSQPARSLLVRGTRKAVLAIGYMRNSWPSLEPRSQCVSPKLRPGVTVLKARAFGGSRVLKFLCCVSSETDGHTLPPFAIPGHSNRKRTGSSDAATLHCWCLYPSHPNPS